MSTISTRGDTVDRRARAAADRDRVADELGGQQFLEVQPDGAGVEAADLEQVLDEALEADDVALQQVERGLGPLGHLVAPGVHHLDRRGQRHQRRPQLVADVGREPGVALDPRSGAPPPCR